MSLPNMLTVRAEICSLIRTAERILIVTSRPVDPDCLGTGLALRWYLRQMGKQAEAVSFFRIPDTMRSFPDIGDVTEADPAAFDFSPYHLIVMVDGSSWSQFFGDPWQKILSGIALHNLVCIDHHVPDEIQQAIPSRCLTVKTSSTAQVLYDYILEPAGAICPPCVCQYLYLALLYDTRGFKNERHEGMYRFAEALLAGGADHLQAVDVNYDEREMTFLTWAIAHTEYHPELGLTLLAINATLRSELKRLLGENWMDCDGLYKEVFLRQVAGYNYGIILIDNLDGTIRLSWRTRNYGAHLSLAEPARLAGYRAGGHRNAGGGSCAGPLSEAKEKLLGEIRKACP